MILFKDEELGKIRQILKQVVKILMSVGVDGLEQVDQEVIRELKAVSQGLERVRLRRLSARIGELALHLGALKQGEGDGDGELAMTLTDCLQTAKFIKAQLREGAPEPSREILDEVLECRWTEKDLTVLEDVSLVELAIESHVHAKTHRVDVRHYVVYESGEILIRRQEMLFPESEDILKPRPSNIPIKVKKGIVFPTFPPREVQLIEFSDRSKPISSKVLEKLVERAAPSVSSTRRRFVKFHDNYFAPMSTPVLLAPQAIVFRGQEAYLMDDKGELLRVDRAEGAQGFALMRAAEKGKIAAVYGRGFVDDLGRFALAPLSAIVVRKELRLVKFL